MTTTRPHSWLVGGHRPDRQRVATEFAADHVRVDCHRRLRGPYTGAGTVLRAVAPEAHRRWPERVRPHLIEILSAAPELKTVLGAPPETLTSLAVPEERTRFYSPLRTRRLAHGLVEFLNGYATHAGPGPLTVFFDNVHAADPTDQEFLAILLRRAALRLRVIIGMNDADLTDELTEALDSYAVRHPVEASRADRERRGHGELLRAYVDSDGTSDEPVELTAYENADPALRAALHDRRAEELEDSDNWTLRLGAIPYHRELGTDPAHAGATALSVAIEWCLNMGFYHAVLESSLRARAVIDPDDQAQFYWRVSTKTTTSLAVLGRSEEAEQIYLELRSRYDIPMLHMLSGYALAMLYTRFHPEERKDYEIARAHVNTAIAIASLLADPAERSFHTVFDRNGLALIETHLGNLTTALNLVTEGIERLDRELDPGQYALHRSVLSHNRAQVHIALGNLDAALTDLTAVIAADPNYPEYYVDRAAVQRRRGDLPAALADYDKAATLTPPIHELYYNRGDLHAAMGNIPAATADFRYTLELEPTESDARINLATLLMETGDLEGAAAQVEQGLAYHPGNADLLCIRGQLAFHAGRPDEARAAFDEALDGNPHLTAALANRAMLHYESGDHDSAIADLGQALDVAGDDPDLRFNRGFAYHAAGRHAEAVDDYTRALTVPDADRAELLYQRSLCYQELGRAEDSRRDLADHLALGPSLHQDEIREQANLLARH
jgi:tetratricopeptide (TPR) repeat protein